MAQITCPYCGATVIAGTIFCDNCGSDLRTITPANMTPISSQPATSPPESGEVCPDCQHENRPGALFCERCGAKLGAQASSMPASEAEHLPVYEPPISVTSKAHLVVSSAHTTLDIPPDKMELVIGREDAIGGVFPDINLEPFGAQDAGVSRRHAKISNTGGAWFIKDLNSVNYTYLNRQRLEPSQPVPLRPDDELRLGKLVLIFKLD